MVSIYNFAALAVTFLVFINSAISQQLYGRHMRRSRYPQYNRLTRSLDQRSANNLPNPATRGRYFGGRAAAPRSKVFGYGGLPKYIMDQPALNSRSKQPQYRPQQQRGYPARGLPQQRGIPQGRFTAPRGLASRTYGQRSSAPYGGGAHLGGGHRGGHRGGYAPGYGSPQYGYSGQGGQPQFPGFNGKYAPIGAPTKNPALGLPFQYGLYTYGDLGGFAYGYKPYYTGYNYPLPTPFGEYPVEESYPGFPDIVHPERHAEEEEEEEEEHKPTHVSYGQTSYEAPSYTLGSEGEAPVEDEQEPHERRIFSDAADEHERSGQ